MDSQLSERHQKILNRFVVACNADERVLAALLMGSYVRGKPDEHSDLDLYLVTTDEAHEDFVNTRDAFARLLGEPLFIEDFDLPNIVFLIYPDGSEVEIHYARASQLGGVFNAPFKVLLDKKNITANLTISEWEVDQTEQTEKLRRLIHWFWHDLSHFIAALGRDQLWWARGQLDVLRAICVSLARLKNNFADTDLGEEVYSKIEKALPLEQLSPLETTFCPMERDAMLESAFVIIRFYKDLAFFLANAHGIIYPDRLEQALVERFEKLRASCSIE